MSSSPPPSAERLGFALSYFERVTCRSCDEDEDDAQREWSAETPCALRLPVDMDAMRACSLDLSSAAFVAVRLGARFWIEKGSVGLLGSQGQCPRDEFEAGAMALMTSSSHAVVIASLARKLHRGLNAGDFVFVSVMTQKARAWPVAASTSFECGSVPFDGFSDEDGRRLAHAVRRSLAFYDGEDRPTGVDQRTHVHFSSSTMPIVIEAIEGEELRRKMLLFCQGHQADWSNVSYPSLMGHSEEVRIRRVWKDETPPSTLQQFAARRPMLFFCTPGGNSARLVDLVNDCAQRMPPAAVDDVMPLTELTHYVQDAFERVSAFTRVFTPSIHVVDELVSKYATIMAADDHEPPLIVALPSRKYAQSWELARELLTARRKVYVWMLLSDESLAKLRRSLGDDVVDSRLGWTPIVDFHLLTATQLRTHRRILMWLDDAERQVSLMVAEKFGDVTDDEL